TAPLSREKFPSFESVRTGRRKAEAAGRLQLVRSGVEHGDVATRKPREEGNAEPDRTAADDQNAGARLDLGGAADGVGADRQKLDHGRIAEAQIAGRVEIFGRNDDLLGHAAIGMDADHLEVFTAIGLALAAGGAMVTGEI